MMVPWQDMETEFSDSPLRKLEDKLFELQHRQNQISYWGLSDETKNAVIEELQKQKKKIIDMIHQKVDEL